MGKLLSPLMLAVFYFLIFPLFMEVWGIMPASEVDSALPKFRQIEKDYRSDILRRFLAEYRSPLTDYADVFITTADKYGIDWRLLPAITGVESTFGKRIPWQSFNAYGWNNGNYRFSSWEQSIDYFMSAISQKENLMYNVF